MSNNKVDVNKYRTELKSLFDFMVELGYTKKPYPKIILDNSDRDDDLLCSTGYFDPNADAIRLFIKERLFKDVMRTAAHEFVHWKQQLDGDIARSGYKSDKISEDENLVKLEAEAYLKGNFGLRKYTEHLQKEGRK